METLKVLLLAEVMLIKPSSLNLNLSVPPELCSVTIGLNVPAIAVTCILIAADGDNVPKLKPVPSKVRSASSIITPTPARAAAKGILPAVRTPFCAVKDIVELPCLYFI